MFCGVTSRLASGVLYPCARKSVQTLRSGTHCPAGRISVSSKYTAVVQAPRSIHAMATRVDTAKVPYEPESVASISVADSISDWKGDVKALGVFEDAFEVKDGAVTYHSEELKALNDSSNSIISEMLTSGDFKGAKGSSISFWQGSPARFLTLVGLGKSKTLIEPRRGTTPFQAAGSAVTAACKSCKGKTALFSWIAPLGDAKVDAIAAAEDVAYGALTSSPEGTRLKSEPGPPPTCQSVEVGLPDGSDAAAAKAAIARGVTLAKGNVYARWLVDAPPNVCNPTYLANCARNIAEKFPDTMSCTVLDKAACEEMNMGCYLAVAACSDHPLQFIHLTYKPPGEVKKKVAVVGKGLTFDSGGYQIKAGMGSMIELMKLDMGGAAATFGAARAVAELQPEGIEVHFISAACENLIDGKGMLPGDVLVSANGKTVEVGNTDAEGRLTLCDALWYAQEKVGATHCVDIATLTGAQIIALGGSIGAVMSPADTAAARVITAGTNTGGEKWWQLPLEDEYFELMKSKVADFNNIGGRAGGSITAGLFLKQFVDSEKMEWTHCDIAGPAFDQASKLGTGFGATTLTHWVEALAKEN